MLNRKHMIQGSEQRNADCILLGLKWEILHPCKYGWPASNMCVHQAWRHDALYCLNNCYGRAQHLNQIFRVKWSQVFYYPSPCSLAQSRVHRRILVLCLRPNHQANATYTPPVEHPLRCFLQHHPLSHPHRSTLRLRKLVCRTKGQSSNGNHFNPYGCPLGNTDDRAAVPYWYHIHEHCRLSGWFDFFIYVCTCLIISKL